MIVLSVVRFLILALAFSMGQSRSSADQTQTESVLNGALYAFEPHTGEIHHRIGRIHLDSINSSSVHSVRLDMGQDGEVLEMVLTQDSVWSDKSIIVVRNGDKVEHVPNTIDSTCYLSGYLTSHKGVVTINRCGHIHGFIHTDGYVYNIEGTEITNDSRNGETDILNIKVVVEKTQGKRDIFNDFTKDFISKDAVKDISDSDDLITKRQYRQAYVESAIFADQYYLQTLARTRGLRTRSDVVNFLIMKWNSIRRFYSNVQEIGVPITMQLKYLELWHFNPVYYARIPLHTNILTFLRAFCYSPLHKVHRFDLKMLYSDAGGATEYRGHAYMEGMCHYKINRNCNIVKSPTAEVNTELHEIGHNLGLDHDSVYDNTGRRCTDATGNGGLMSENYTPKFLDCYRTVLRNKLTSHWYKCLYIIDVPELSVKA